MTQARLVGENEASIPGNGRFDQSFLNPLHACPKDFWRFTPDALSLLHQDWSEIIEVGGWGNFATWSLVQDGLRFTGVPSANWHPLHKIAMYNDPLWPIVTWIIARK